MDFLHFRVTRINLKGNSWQKNCSLFCRFLLFTIKLWPCSNTPTSSLLLWLSNPLHQWVNGGRLYDFTRLNFTQSFVCLSVYPHDISKTDAARITKLATDLQMFNDECSKSIYFGIKRFKVTSHRTVPGWVFALSWVLAFSTCIFSFMLNVNWYYRRWLCKGPFRLRQTSDCSCLSVQNSSRSSAKREKSFWFYFKSLIWKKNIDGEQKNKQWCGVIVPGVWVLVQFRIWSPIFNIPESESCQKKLLLLDFFSCCSAV